MAAHSTWGRVGRATRHERGRVRCGRCGGVGRGGPLSWELHLRWLAAHSTAGDSLVRPPELATPQVDGSSLDLRPGSERAKTHEQGQVAGGRCGGVGRCGPLSWQPHLRWTTAHSTDGDSLVRPPELAATPEVDGSSLDLRPGRREQRRTKRGRFAAAGAAVSVAAAQCAGSSTPGGRHLTRLAGDSARSAHCAAGHTPRWPAAHSTAGDSARSARCAGWPHLRWLGAHSTAAEGPRRVPLPYSRSFLEWPPTGHRPATPRAARSIRRRRRLRWPGR